MKILSEGSEVEQGVRKVFMLKITIKVDLWNCLAARKIVGCVVEKATLLTAVYRPFFVRTLAEIEVDLVELVRMSVFVPLLVQID